MQWFGRVLCWQESTIETYLSAVWDEKYRSVTIRIQERNGKLINTIMGKMTGFIKPPVTYHNIGYIPGYDKTLTYPIITTAIAAEIRAVVA